MWAFLNPERVERQYVPQTRAACNGAQIIARDFSRFRKFPALLFERFKNLLRCLSDFLLDLAGVVESFGGYG